MSVGLPDFLTELLEGLRGPFSPVTAAGPGGTTSAPVLHLPEGITHPYNVTSLSPTKRAGAISDQSSGTKRSTIINNTTPSRAATPTSASPTTSTGATSSDPTTGANLYGDPTTDGTSVALPAATTTDNGPNVLLIVGVIALGALAYWYFRVRKRA